jgi:prepilin-type N-terminal cleavage/methylation domain-containing protein
VSSKRVWVRPRKGFTLIEMLIVVSVIAILAALLLPTISAVRLSAKKKATRLLVEGIVAGLKRYYTDFDEYPPSSLAKPGGVPYEPGSIYKYLCGDKGQGLIKTEAGKKQHIDPYVVIPPENIRRDSNIVYVTDSWGKDIQYANCKAFTDNAKAGTPDYVAVPTNETHNPNGVDVWSYGPDRVEAKDGLMDLEDDIANWVSDKLQTQ